MPDPRKERDGGRIEPGKSQQKDAAGREHRSKTAGTNRDFDESGESDNQGHGHPREEREGQKRG